MTVTELGLHSPWLRIARKRDYTWSDGKHTPGFSRAIFREAYRGHVASTPESAPTERQWITLHVNGHPEACAYACLNDAVASLARRPVGFTYEIYRGGRRLFQFGVTLESNRARQ